MEPAANRDGAIVPPWQFFSSPSYCWRSSGLMEWSHTTNTWQEQVGSPGPPNLHSLSYLTVITSIFLFTYYTHIHLCDVYLHIFSVDMYLGFSVLNGMFCRMKAFNFDKVQFTFKKEFKVFVFHYYHEFSKISSISFQGPFNVNFPFSSLWSSWSEHLCLVLGLTLNFFYMVSSDTPLESFLVTSSQLDCLSSVSVVMRSFFRV